MVTAACVCPSVAPQSTFVALRLTLPLMPRSAIVGVHGWA
ncbi:CRISPR-associated protein Cas5 [Roseovarius mucosus]